MSFDPAAKSSLTSAGFDGPDADAAEEFLASVRENHLVQSAGRSARNPEDPDDGAVVFVRSSALPEEYVGLKTPGAAWFASDRQARLVKTLQQREYATAAELADAADVSKEHVRATLKRLVAADAEFVECREEAGEHGAHLSRGLAGFGTEPAVVDTTSEEPANGGVWETSTWALVVSAGYTLPASPTTLDQPTTSRVRIGFGPTAAANPGADPDRLTGENPSCARAHLRTVGDPQGVSRRRPVAAEPRSGSGPARRPRIRGRRRPARLPKESSPESRTRAAQNSNRAPGGCHGG